MDRMDKIEISLNYLEVVMLISALTTFAAELSERKDGSDVARTAGLIKILDYRAYLEDVRDEMRRQMDIERQTRQN
jgi:hypothetical protein